MSLVALVSGGLDSAVMESLALESGAKVRPLFVDYGQRAAKPEWRACRTIHRRLGWPTPKRLDVSGFGETILSGLTSRKKDLLRDAFTPGRNLLLLVLGAAYAYQVQANAVAIGILRTGHRLFPDQRKRFLTRAESAVSLAIGRRCEIVAPLITLDKAEIVALATKRGIEGTYSCHRGNQVPCERCISCLELAETRRR